MRRRIWIAIAVLLALIGLGALGAFYAARPALLKVAVASDTEDHKLMFAIAHTFASAHKPIRLRIVPVGSAAAAAAALDAGEVDLAVVRSDIAMPAKGAALAILHHNAVVLIVSDQQIPSVSDLRGKKIGVVHAAATGQGNQALLQKILRHYSIPLDAVTIIPLSRMETVSALRERRIDILLVVAALASDSLSDLVASIQAGDQPINFLPIAESKAIAQRNPALETLEVLRGMFGGDPPRPLANFDTVGVSVLLTAPAAMPENLAADLTRAIFAERRAIAKLAPLANQIQALSTDKDAPLSVHPGAAAYFDDEEQSFFDRYSDFFYIAAMLLSVIGSGMAALASRWSAVSHNELDAAIERMMELLRTARLAADLPELEAIERETDDLLAGCVAQRKKRGFDQQGMSALRLALEQTRFAIQERRRQLNGRAMDSPA